jgi:hypothetical protein
MSGFLHEFEQFIDECRRKNSVTRALIEDLFDGAWVTSMSPEIVGLFRNALRAAGGGFGPNNAIRAERCPSTFTGPCLDFETRSLRMARGVDYLGMYAGVMILQGEDLPPYEGMTIEYRTHGDGVASQHFVTNDAHGEVLEPLEWTIGGFVRELVKGDRPPGWVPLASGNAVRVSDRPTWSTSVVSRGSRVISAPRV